MSLTRYEFFTIIGTLVGVGIALGALMFDITHRLDSAIAQAEADRRVENAKMDEFRTQAADDRRTEDAKMDGYRRHMQRLGVQ